MSRIAHMQVDLPNHLVAPLGALSQSRGGTIFMVLLTALKALLLGQTGRNDICVATAMANRSQLKSERVIGPMVNTTIIRTNLNFDLSFEQALDRVRDSVLEVDARQQLPFDIVAARLEEEADLDPATLVQVFLILQNPLRRSLKFIDVATRPFGDLYRQGQPVFPIDRSWISMMLKETESGINGACLYKSDLFESNTIQHWIADYEKILARAVENPKILLGRLVNR